VNFGTQTVIANLDVTIAGNGYNVNGRTTYSGSQFFISPTVTPTAGSACTQGCSGQLSGFFAGPSAERAGVGYQVNDGFNNLQILGAAAFKKN
jgi:hypothetical protein